LLGNQVASPVKSEAIAATVFAIPQNSHWQGQSVGLGDGNIFYF